MTPTFAFKGSYRGEITYAIRDETGAYEADLRFDVIPYEESRYNGSRDEYERDVAAALNLLHRHNENWLAIPSATIDAFNAWLAAEFSRTRAYILANPHRYGITSPDDPFFIKPTPAGGAHYQVGKGWIIDAPPPNELPLLS